MKKWISLIIAAVLSFSFTACSKKQEVKDTNIVDKDWNSILSEAKGSTVTFYGWGGSDMTNKWLDDFVAKNLKEQYDINFKRVGMNIEDILNKLLGEKQAGTAKGNIDIVWINGENFFTAKKNSLIFGAFADKLPNYNKLVDKNSIEVKYDFGYPVEGLEVPYGKAQFVMMSNTNKVTKAPSSHEELLQFVKSNPGKFTYPAPPDFTGSAFVRNIIYDIVVYQQFVEMKADKDTVQKAIQPAIDYLKELKPYLWNQGKTYPATIDQLDNMYADGQVLMSMTYSPFSISGRVNKGELPKGTEASIFNKGTIGNTHFLTVPFNAPNKAGALVALNFIMSAKAQASKYNPENWGDLPVLDNSKLDDSEKKLFQEVNLGQGTLPQDELLKHRVPEMPADLVPIIEKIWLENIPKGD